MRLFNGVSICFFLFIKISVAFDIPGWTAYVPDQFTNSVTPIDLASDFLGAPIAVGTRPTLAVISPDGTTAYVLNSGSPEIFQQPSVPGTVTVVDVATGIALTTVFFTGMESDFFPRGIAITPGGDTVYVTGTDDFNNGFLIPISTLTNQAGTPLFLNAFGPGDVAITPDGLKAFILHNNQVIVVDLITQVVTTLINTPDFLTSLAMTPDNTTAYVVSSNLLLYPIDIATLSAQIPIGLPCVGYEIAITPNGETIYITCPNGGNTWVLPVDVATNTPEPVISTSPAQPFGIAIAPDGQTVYVTTSSPSVIPIDVATQTALPPISFENGADSIVITPDQAPVANFAVELGGVGSSTNFDASGSYSPVGTITTYAWDFGDGDTDVSEFPTISHIYAQPGTYEVLLTVTNSAGTSTMQTFTGKTVSNNGGENAQTSQSITIGNLAPPTNLTGKRIARCYNSLNIITWSAPSGTPPAAYRVYRNSLDSLVATIAGDRAHKYVDRHIWQSVAYTYYVVSVDEEGNESAPASITIYPSFVACQQ